VKAWKEITFAFLVCYPTATREREREKERKKERKKKRRFLYRNWAEHFSIGMNLNLQYEVNGKIRLTLWIFNIQTHIQEHSPCICQKHSELPNLFTQYDKTFYNSPMIT
jgi:hypothetical protein